MSIPEDTDEDDFTGDVDTDYSSGDETRDCNSVGNDFDCWSGTSEAWTCNPFPAVGVDG